MSTMYCRLISFLLGLTAIGLSYVPAKAQAISADGTTSTIVTGSPDFTVNGGDRPDGGPNLFHSFSDFSVPTGGSVVFNNSTDVQTIFSRVTGTMPSTINGAIRAKGVADLFLLNPNGILLGPASSLDIGGSFIGTTASSILFDDGVAFSATDTAVSPLLSISSPIGLQMGETPGMITVESSRFRGADEETLALIGTELLLQGPSDFTYFSTPDGHIELGSVGEGSFVSLEQGVTPAEQSWAFNYDAVTDFEDIMINRAWVEAGGDGGGTIQLQGQNVELQNGSEVYTLTFGAVSGGGITINASESLSVVGMAANDRYSTGVVANVRTGASGRGGDINIRTPSLNVLEGAVILLGGYGDGNTGDLTVNADEIEISGARRFASRIVSFKNDNSSGVGGNITLDTDQLTLADSGRLIAFTNGSSASGNLEVMADNISVAGNTTSNNGVPQAFMGVFTNGDGAARTAKITTEQLTLTGDAQIYMGTRGLGSGGNLILRTTDINFDRAGYTGLLSTGINSSVSGGGQGNAGIIDIETQQLTMLNGAQIFGGNSSNGNGGLIKIVAAEVIGVGTGLESDNNRVVPSGINAVTNLGAVGDAGDIELITGRLYLAEGAQVTNSIIGTGAAGNIGITADEIVLTGQSDGELPSGIFATVLSSGTGNGGEIDLTSDRILVQAGAQISSGTSGEGNAGTIRIQASDRIEIDGESSAILGSVGSTAIGDGGRIEITTQQFQASNSGRVSTETNGQGKAGDINIQADSFLLVDNAEVASRSTSDSDGGNIRLTGNTATLRNNAQLNASTRSSNGGNLALDFSDVLTLQNQSQLTAEAGGLGNGGNLFLQAAFVIGTGNSDIIANAEQGNGGNIDITTQGIFGLKFRDQLTPENDITASSEFGINGTVAIRDLSVDPGNALADLPEAPKDADNQVAASCESTGGNQFIASGRGGLPVSPQQQTTGARLWSDIRDLSSSSERSFSESSVSRTESYQRPENIKLAEVSEPIFIAEASGWERNSDLQVELLTDSRTTASSSIRAANCLASGAS